ncbi:transcription initiation factor tfiia-like protein [Vairimorpha ceranae]|nr:transcription initiation factor tfiia-like protein [Vairimorpha ceranae]KKO76407.1 transcription initiation factor tfiia-like protein [Vairimorpha ceranae]
MSRIYTDLIEEVLTKLELEGEPEGIGRNLIFDIQNGWRRNIRDWYENASNEDKHTFEDKRMAYNSTTDGYISSDEEYEMMEDTSNFLMCMYVKVSRTKCKYKCNFKQGFVNLGNVDFAFANAQGELEW